MKRQILLAALIALAACGDIVPGTLRAARTLDPLTADPAVIALRLDLPDSLRVVPGSARLKLGARNRAGEVLGQSFVLELRNNVLAVAEGDHAALRQLQKQIGAWKAADPDGTLGTLSLDFRPCRTQDTIPDDARGSVSIRLAQDGPFLPLIQEGPVRALLKEVSPNGMGPCT
jgi:hypothetical protein